jgi:hypothetical protein
VSQPSHFVIELKQQPDGQWHAQMRYENEPSRFFLGVSSPAPLGALLELVVMTIRTRLF